MKKLTLLQKVRIWANHRLTQSNKSWSPVLILILAIEKKAYNLYKISKIKEEIYFIIYCFMFLKWQDIWKGKKI